MPPPTPGNSFGDRLIWVGHATVLLELGGRRLLTDPVLRSRVGPIARAAAPADAAVAQNLDAVLVSHVHYDHLDARSLRRIDGATPVIAPRGAGRLLRRLGFASVTEIAVGETVDVAGVAVRAVPAHHDGRRHPFGADRAETVGFLVGDSPRVYFAGDTEQFDGMADLAAGLDVALLPIAGWGPTLGAGHLGPREAASALTLLRPRVAVPIHWGTLYLRGLGLRRRLADPPHAFARHAAELAPAVDVRLLAPGDELGLGELGPS